MKYKIKNVHKFLIIFLSILSLSFTISINNAYANMFNKFKKGFYFEKYDNAEEAKAALLELHPIGSNVNGLVRTLEGAGVICAIRNDKTNDRYSKITNAGDFYHCAYMHKHFFIFSKSWKINVNVNITNLAITEIYVISGIDTI